MSDHNQPRLPVLAIDGGAWKLYKSKHQVLSEENYRIYYQEGHNLEGTKYVWIKKSRVPANSRKAWPPQQVKVDDIKQFASKISYTSTDMTRLQKK